MLTATATSIYEPYATRDKRSNGGSRTTRTNVESTDGGIITTLCTKHTNKYATRQSQKRVE